MAVVTQVNRWLSVRLEMVGIFVVFGTSVFATVLLRRSAGIAGLAITSALNLTGLLNWFVRVSSELEVKSDLHLVFAWFYPIVQYDHRNKMCLAVNSNAMQH